MSKQYMQEAIDELNQLREMKESIQNIIKSNIPDTMDTPISFGICAVVGYEVLMLMGEVNAKLHRLGGRSDPRGISEREQDGC